MRKLFAMALAAGLCLALAAPAAAKYTVGGKMLSVVGWRGASAARNGSGREVTTFFSAVEGYSRLFVTFVTPARDAGGHVELGLSSFTGSGVSLRHIYGWYQAGNCKLLAGHTDNWFGSLVAAPAQNLSFTPWLKWLMIDWGNQWGLRRPQVSFTYGKGAWGVQAGVAQPLRAGSLSFNGTAVDVYNALPEIWLAFRFRAGGFTIIPSFSWTRYGAEGVASGDDSVDGWALVAPAKLNLGPFSLRFGLHYIENKGLTSLANWADSDNGLPLLQTDGRFSDTSQVGGFLAAHYRVGRWKIFGGLGLEKLSNDAWSKKDYTRVGCFLAASYAVSENFTINPEIGRYDYGDDENTGHDAGNEWMAGAQLAFFF